MGILSSPDPVSDNAALEEITKEHVFEQFMELHGQFRGNEDFNAMVVTNGPTADVTMVQGSFQDIKFRALMHESCIASPCDPSFTDPDEVKKLVSLHPNATSIRPSGEDDRAARFGDVCLVSYVKNGPNNNGLMRGPRFQFPNKYNKYNYECANKEILATDAFSSANVQTLDKVPDLTDFTGGFENPWGLKPRKGIYNGSYMPKGTPVINGYPVHGSKILASPNTATWTGTTSGAKILADHVDGFNRMTAAFSAHFSKPGGPVVKFKCSGIRTFDGQISVRKRGVKNGTCASMTVGSGGTCKSARPGTSNHGWGEAVDIKKIDGSGYLTFDSKEYKWLVANAEQYGWHHPSWAKPKSEGGTLPEAWHWEPINKVIKKLKV